MTARSQPRPRRAGAAAPLGAIALAAVLAGPGCVTERPGARPRARAPETTAAEKPRLPEGPIASPVPPGGTITARFNMRVLPLGGVAYDGQVLPVVSPDGSFIAVEQGDAPTWPTLLAEPDATPASGTRVALCDIRTPPAREITQSDPLPRGVILGRSADTRGCLVEWPRADGARWIGRAPWAGTKVDWLVQDGAVNAHAVIGPDGTLAYTRRPVGAGSRSELIVRTPEGTVLSYGPGDASCCFPVFAPGGNVVCTLVLSSAGLEIVALRTRYADGTRPATLGPPLSSRVLSPAPDLTAAYQAVAGAPAGPLAGKEDPTGAGDAVLLFHPGLQRMAAFWWRDGSIFPLAANSVAATHSPLVDPPGFFLTTADGLAFAPMPRDVNATTGPSSVRVMEATYVARATSNSDRPLILIGPASRTDPTRLTVVACSPLPQAGPPENTAK